MLTSNQSCSHFIKNLLINKQVSFEPHVPLLSTINTYIHGRGGLTLDLIAYHPFRCYAGNSHSHVLPHCLNGCQAVQTSCAQPALLAGAGTDQRKPHPLHKYKLSRQVAEALPPVYQRLSDSLLLEQCKGNKTENPAERLHTVLWTVLSKDERTSLFGVRTEMQYEAVARNNCGYLLAYAQFHSSWGRRPGMLAPQRAAEEDLQRSSKAAHAHEGS